MSETVACQCCYCGTWQQVEPPPSLVVCRECKHEFRTFMKRNASPVMELSPAALAFFAKHKEQGAA